jgi:hypothetical protein
MALKATTAEAKKTCAKTNCALESRSDQMKAAA